MPDDQERPVPSAREVDPRSAELGASLRRVRERRGMGVRELARRIDVSASLISRIEKGSVMPSVATLFALRDALDVPMSEIMGDDGIAGVERPAPPENGNPAAPVIERQGAPPAMWGPGLGGSQGVQRAAGRDKIDLGSGVHWERLTPGPDPIQFTYSVYRPGSSSSEAGTFLRHSGREYGYIVSGRLSVTLAFETFHLEAGDSIAFDSSVPHRLFNDGDVDVVSIWVAMPWMPDPGAGS